MKKSLERKIYQKMNEMDFKEPVESTLFDQEESKYYMELFKQRKEQKQQPISKTGYGRWLSYAAAVILLILLPVTAYAAVTGNLKGLLTRNNLGSATQQNTLAKIKDKKWEDAKSQEITEYEAYGIKMRIYYCLYDQKGESLYLAYTVEQDDPDVYLQGNLSDCHVPVYSLKDIERSSVSVDLVKDDENYYSCNRISWEEEVDGVTLQCLQIDWAGEPLKLQFTKMVSGNFWDEYDKWKEKKQKQFSLPKGEAIKTITLHAEEDPKITLQISAQSMRLVTISDRMEQILEADPFDLSATLYTTEGQIPVDIHSSMDEEEMYACYVLGGADLEKIRKVKIMDYTFVLPQK